MLVRGLRPPRRRYLVVLGLMLAALAALIPVAIAQMTQTQATRGWQAPTKAEYARMQRSLTAWACQQNPGCTIAVPRSKIHVGKVSIGGYGVIYATAQVILNPHSPDPQGGITLLYRHGPAAATGAHGRIVGSPNWWVPDGSPYIDGAPFTTLEKFAPALCHYAKSKLQAQPNGC